MNRLKIWAVAAGLFMLAAGLAQGGPITVYQDAPSGMADNLTRGFYISNYSANNLSTVTLYYDANGAGQYTASLTARLNTYDGSILGTAQQATFNVPNQGETAVTFDFGGAAVPVGSTITFAQTLVSGPSSLFFDTGTQGPAGVSETEATTAPLDIFRRSQVATSITALGTTTPEPSSVVLMGVGLASLSFLRRVRR